MALRSVTLPNGQIVNNVPDNISDEAVADRLISSGMASISDIYPDLKTSADIYPFLGEIAGGIGGGIAGGALAGTAILPGVGTFVGALIGGATGTFLGSFAGEAAEASFEDRRLDIEDAAKKAGKAAAIDTVFGLGLGAAGKIARKMFSPLLDLANPSVVPIDQLDEALELQQKFVDLAKSGEAPTSLLPSSAGIADPISRISETYAKSARTYEIQMNKMKKGYEEFAAQSVDNILKQLPDVSRKQFGDNLLRITEEVESAVSAKVDPLYKTLDLEGGFAISKADILSDFDKSVARYSKGRKDYFGNPIISRDSQRIYDFVNKMQKEVQPADLAMLSRDFSKLRASDPLAQNLKNTFIAKQNRLLTNPALVDTKKMIFRANEIGKLRVSDVGLRQKTAAEKAAYDYITKRRARMSFSEAQKELSYMKGRLRDIQKSTTPDAEALRLWNSAVVNLENAMKEAAERVGGDIYDKYRKVSNLWRTATDTIHAPYIRKAVENNALERAAEILTKTGEITPVREVQDLMNLAKKLGIKDNQNISQQLQRKFLDKLFADPEIGNIAQLATKLKNPLFRDTFDEVLSKDIGKQVRTLITEADLITGMSARRSGESLGIASREIGAVTNPNIIKTIVFGLAPKIVEKRLSNKTIKGKLEAMKKIREALEAEKNIPPAAARSLLKEIPTVTGVGAGAILIPKGND